MTLLFLHVMATMHNLYVCYWNTGVGLVEVVYTLHNEYYCLLPGIHGGPEIAPLSSGDI